MAALITRVMNYYQANPALGKMAEIAEEFEFCQKSIDLLELNNFVTGKDLLAIKPARVRELLLPMKNSLNLEKFIRRHTVEEEATSVVPPGGAANQGLLNQTTANRSHNPHSSTSN
ncbi:hypothetical protein BV898_16372 [Hypsibius exemplaris]|nr:hypothetical protein BV898_16372 [Hypsibius exemplaris]